MSGYQASKRITIYPMASSSSKTLSFTNESNNILNESEK